MRISKIGLNFQVSNNRNKKNLTVAKTQPEFKGVKSPNNSFEKCFKNNIKIVFSDIDGTISAHSDILSLNTIKTIETLYKNKIPVVLTTARCYQDTLPIIEQFSHNPDYTIVLQGGELINSSGIPFFENVISTKSGKKLLKWFKSIRKQDKNSHLIMYFNEQPYSVSSIQYPWKAKSPIIRVNSFDELFDKNMKLQKALIYKSDAHSCPNYNQNKIIDSFNYCNIPDLKINPSSLSVLEFQNNWVSKDKAIDFLLRALKIEPRQAMVIGDSSNDIEMMDFIRKEGGLAIAMGNANEFVKKHANAITSSVTQDGFSKVIEKLF